MAADDKKLVDKNHETYCKQPEPKPESKPEPKPTDPKDGLDPKYLDGAKTIGSFGALALASFSFFAF